MPESDLDLLEILCREFHIRRSEVLFQTMKLGRAWDRHNPRLLSEQPCQGNLCPRRFLRLRDLA
jgi:hypothetical protein